jgi:uncharacterized tellurite resistance protein B-like protein
MLLRADALALLKVLIAASWADSRISQAELNYIKHLGQQFRLTDADWIELEPYLEDAPGDAEVIELFRDLVTRIGTPGTRDQVLQHIEEILKSDAQMTADEHDFLDEYSAIVREASTVDLLLGRMKSLFQKRPPAAALDLEEFIRNKVLFKLRRRLGAEQITPEMHRLCLIGGLMGLVAQADGEIHERELSEIRSHLHVRGKFSPEALDVLMAVVSEESVRGLDRSRIVAGLGQNITFEQKIELLDLLFAVASADGSLTHAELEELRGISAALHLSHRQYIDAKVRSRSLA